MLINHTANLLWSAFCTLAATIVQSNVFDGVIVRVLLHAAHSVNTVAHQLELVV
jgi:hypothetical protein